MIKKLLLIGVFIAFNSCGNENKVTPDSSEIDRQISALPYFNSADFTPQWNTPIHKIPPFSFLDQNGDTISNATYKGHIYVANFFFTICPGICPKLTENMSSLQEFYQNDDAIMLLSHTVMPWVDTVEELKKYSIRKGVNAEKWHLVTGDKTELYTIARDGYFADEDFTKTTDVDDFIHTENFILVDKKGYIRGVYNGTIALDIKRLMRHIDILKNEDIQ
ncbi:SCO family protein [Cellulophaga baltica]|uniref:SCO family protein n=1 Tax=Cellulophaga baltica TaxID=76594 RepID=UPI002495186A|nr:SCO family protein [Cellulophaga baltica]